MICLNHTPGMVNEMLVMCGYQGVKCQVPTREEWLRFAENFPSYYFD